MKYPLIESLGLKVFERGYAPDLQQSGYDGRMDFVSAPDLESLLEKGVRVYGGRNGAALSSDKFLGDTHVGLLLDYKPIKKPKPVTKEEIRKYLEDNQQWSGSLMSLLKRIERDGLE